MKASEVFLEFVRPLYEEGIPSDIDEVGLKKLFIAPITVWNAVVMDKNLKRRRGDMPKYLREHLQTTGTRHRRILREFYRFWVLRKDHLFAHCDWPLDIEVYKNVKGELIVRAKTFALNGLPSPNFPAEWIKEKSLAPVTPLPTKTLEW